ncbi:MAG: IPT/TIG domain-containing protein [Alphaproteobacteria bacterium]|nr:IPT/TIG domain-containing protein [Alphaproteobacteria bacterium]
MRLSHLSFCAGLLTLALSTGCGLDFFAPDAQALLDDSGVLDSRPGQGDDTGNGGRDDTGNGGGDDSQLQEGEGPTVDYYDPAYGPASGGTLVSLIGGPFDETTTVRFGDVPATITDRTQTTLTARSPAGADGAVDLVLTNAEGRTTLPEAFYYFTDGGGLAGTFGELWWVDYQGNYWTNPPTDFGGARWSLIEAQDLDYWDLFAPAEDTCRSEYSFPGDILVYDLDVPSTSIRSSSSANINMSWDSEALQWASTAELTSAQWVANSTYDLTTINDGVLPGFTVQPLVTTPRAFSVTGPSQLVHNDQYLQNITRNQLNFTWSSSDADAMVLQFGITNAAGTGFQEVVTCWARNDGSFNVPASSFTSWTAGRYLYAYVGSVVQSGGTLPTNGAESRVAGVYFKLHVGYMQ